MHAPPPPPVAAPCAPTAAAAAPSPPPDLWWRVVAEVRSWRRGTISIHEVDVWLRFNPYIRRGFRQRHLRRREAVGSVFLYLHNETANIYSHLVMAVLMLALLLWPPRLPLGAAGEEAAGSAGVLSTVYQDARARSSEAQPHRGPATASAGAVRGAAGGGAEVPVWLRGLRGLREDAAPSGPRKGEEDEGGDAAASAAAVRGFVLQGGGASPRELLPDVGAASASGPVALRFFSFLSPRLRSAAPVPSPATGLVAAAAPPPLSLDGRLAASLTPLLLGLLATFVLSVGYHAFMPCCRSRRGYQQLLQCDVMGVVFSIAGSAYTYFTCGMPCVTDSVQTTAAVAMVGATGLCVYVLVLAPMWGVLEEWSRLAWAAVKWAAATALATALERATGRPLEPAPAQGTRGGGAGSGAAHTAPQRSRSTRQTPPPPHAVLAWVQRHRRLDSISRAEECARGASEPAHISARQRAAIVGVYCLMHLGVYLALVHPKSRQDMGGFTQGTQYHNAAYAWLFVGGLVNAMRFPESLVFRWTRSAARHTRRVATAEAAAWCAKELVREAAAQAGAAGGTPADARRDPGHRGSRSGEAGHTGGSTTPPRSSLAAPGWWERLCVPKLFVTYVLPASTLDYVGNSHNIWHVCTAMSAASTILAVYYDCMEYDLVRCT